MVVTDFWRSLENSFLITWRQLVLSFSVHSLMGYALGRNKANSKFYSFVYLFIVSGMFVPFAILMMPLAKQTAELGLANWVRCYPPVCCILYADECTFVFRLSGEYTDGAGRSGKGGRRFHMENLLEDHFPDYAPYACDGCCPDGIGGME